MTDSYLKLRCLSVPEFATARFAPKRSRLKKEARALRAEALAPYESRVCARDRGPRFFDYFIASLLYFVNSPVMFLNNACG